jgi:hypothetical protein
VWRSTFSLHTHVLKASKSEPQECITHSRIVVMSIERGWVPYRIYIFVLPTLFCTYFVLTPLRSSCKVLEASIIELRSARSLLRIKECPDSVSPLEMSKRSSCQTVDLEFGVAHVYGAIKMHSCLRNATVAMEIS